MIEDRDVRRPLDDKEKTEIAARLRGGENPHDLAFQFRVPALWIMRIADSIERARITAEREKLRRARVRAVTELGRARALNITPAPPTQPSMKALCSMDRIRVGVRNGEND